jgi:ADP-ribose pyrophosphatase YjhB (NUDIX family)
MIHFCSACGAATKTLIPTGDSRLRDVCSKPSCGLVHYENPKIVAGTLPIWQGKVLLCKRAIEPRLGYWTLPAGFMELDESCEQGAARETQEEANASVHLRGLLSVLSVPYTSQVHLFYLADLIDGQFSSSSESLEVALFSEAEIPWQDLAFQTVSQTLRHYFAQADKANPAQLNAVIEQTNLGV